MCVRGCQGAAGTHTHTTSEREREKEREREEGGQRERKREGGKRQRKYGVLYMYERETTREGDRGRQSGNV